MKTFLARPLLAAFFLAPVGAQAFCGLHSCPRNAAAQTDWEAELRTRYTTFQVAGESGSYNLTGVRVFRRIGGFVLGAEVPLARLHLAEESRTGLSNPVLVAQYQQPFAETWMWEAGLQAELPFGNSEAGLAGDHAMLLPWAGLKRMFGMSWTATGLLGYGQSLGGGAHAHQHHSARVLSQARTAHAGHDHGAPPDPGSSHASASRLWVNPHGDREIHARAGMGWRQGRSNLEGFTMGQFDVSTADAVAYARAGLQWEWSVTPTLRVHVNGEVPVTEERRSAAELGAGVKIGW